MSIWTGSLSGPDCALWIAKLPHRGSFNEGRHAAQPFVSHLMTSRFTGYAFAYEQGSLLGVQLFLLGKAISTAFEQVTGEVAALQLQSRVGTLELEALRASRPQVLAALAASAGQFSGEVPDPIPEQLSAWQQRLSSGFTGLIGRFQTGGTLQEVYGYHEGRPLGLGLPVSGANSTFIQLSSPPSPLFSEGQEQPLQPPPAPSPVLAAAPPVAPIAPAAPDAEQVWLAAQAAFSSELGPAGVNAANKLRASVGNLSVQAQLDAIRQRLSATLGARAAAMFERQLEGGSSS